jgi:hypothetical protein
MAPPRGDAVIEYPSSHIQIGGAHSGIAPAHLLDVQDANGNIYYWADRRGLFPAVITADGSPAGKSYLDWLVSAGPWTFHRSLQTDMGELVIQNVSGDSLARDFEKIARRTVLEGAFFVYRYWQASAEAAWIEVHGTLTVDDISRDSVRLRGAQLLDASNTDTPQFNFSESCPWDWGSKRCGATGNVECMYSFPSCQVPERFGGVINNYEKNYGETSASVAAITINRRRKI